MATVKLMLDKGYSSKSKNGQSTYPLVLRVSHQSKKKYISTGFHLNESHWDESNERVTKDYKAHSQANSKASKYLSVGLEVCSLPKENLRKLTVYQIAKIIEDKISDQVLSDPITSNLLMADQTTLAGYGKRVMERYTKAGKYGSVIKFQNVINSITKFYGEDILLSQITPTFLLDYEADWLDRGNNMGGLATYLKSLRTLFNLAIRDSSTGLNKDFYPFGRDGYIIKKGKAPLKRAISLEYIQKIRELDYKPGTTIWHHRNYFLFMFNLRGMNFVDLCFLRLENIKNDRLIYVRSKTKTGENVKTFNIKLTSEAIEIIKHYSEGKKKNDLLFPMLEDVINSGDKLLIWNTRKKQLDSHNQFLKKIAKDIDLDVSLTTYVARHTFATAGLHKGIPKSQLGEMLGHTNAVITEAYFADFDQEVLDEAADRIFE